MDNEQKVGIASAVDMHVVSGQVASVWRPGARLPQNTDHIPSFNSTASSRRGIVLTGRTDTYQPILAMPTVTADAILFDMDGTLIDSTPGVLLAWDSFAHTYGFDGAAAAHAAHGRRLADTLGEWCKITDAQTLQDEIVRFEQEVIEGGPIVLPGAVELLAQISAGTPAAHGWTIVTSATNVYTPKALARCGVPLPQAGYVTSDDVQRGKPHPDPYLAGAQKVGVDPARCLVIEDAPSGLNAGRAAGAKVLAVCTSHSRDAIVASGADPDYIVKDLTRVSARWEGGKVLLDIDDSLW